MSKTSNDRQNVVVVGGGGAGAPTARQLSTTLDPTKYNLIVITARPYFMHLPGCVRAAVTPEGDFHEQVFMPYDKLLVNGNGTFVTGEVTSIADEGEKGGYVTLADGQQIRYSVLVLAPGSHWEGPLALPDTKSETSQQFKGWHAKFEKANDILLVGGGAVAIEYAGEIKDLNPAKKVTIVHGNSQLLNDAYPEKYRKDIERRLKARGVELVLGDIVPEDAQTGDEKTITTRNGKILSPDLIVPCRGGRPNVAFITASLGADILATSGYVKIDATFQLPAHPRIFAAGDIADLKEQKQVGKYGGHASIIAANVLSILSGQKATQAYKGSSEMIIITIGKNGGAAYFGVLWGLMFGDWVSSLIKSKNLLTPLVRKGLGLGATD
ncbi:hypothetical protein FPV67DRAFT_1561581 [Lyophyllum atratum]|nr:hypothetical protein FPV67DRAFT_1561581 [Lyophyllum atratum]